MQPLQPGMVQDKDGVRGTVISAASPSSDQDRQVLVELESGSRVWVAAEAFVQQPDGSYYVPLQLAELVRRTRESASEEFVLPVMLEELDVQKRLIETGKVRITKAVHEREVVVDEPLWQDEVSITRVTVQRVVDGPVPVRHEDDTMIVPILEEVLVLEKRLMLKEELHIRKRRIETHQPQQVTLWSEEARVERLKTAEP